MKKRLSLILAAVFALALLPATAIPARAAGEANYALQIKSDGNGGYNLYAQYNDGSATPYADIDTLADNEGKWSIETNSDGFPVLTLKDGFAFSTTSHVGLATGANINTEVIIQLETGAEASITALGAASGSYLSAICFLHPSVTTIQGAGVLTLTAGNTTDTNSKNAYALEVTNALTIKDGATVNTKAETPADGSSTSGFGIYVGYGPFHIDHATVTIEVTGEGNGYVCAGPIKPNLSGVVATGGTASTMVGLNPVQWDDVACCYQTYDGTPENCTNLKFAPEDRTLYFDGTALYYTKQMNFGDKVAASDIDYDAEAATLTFDSAFSYTTSRAYGLYMAPGTTLEANAPVSLKTTVASAGAALYGLGALTITGGGGVTADGGPGQSSYGIFDDNNAPTITGPVTAKGNKAIGPQEPTTTGAVLRGSADYNAAIGTGDVSWVNGLSSYTMDGFPGRVAQCVSILFPATNGLLFDGSTLQYSDGSPYTGSYSIDTATKTLTLYDGFHFVTRENTALQITADPAVIHLEGKASLLSVFAGEDYSYGIHAAGDLTIKGDGALAVQSGKNTSTSVNKGSYGIYAGWLKTLSLEGDVQVHALGDIAYGGSCGAAAGTINLSDAAGLTATAAGVAAAYSGSSSTGIYTKNLKMTGTSEVTAQGGDAPGTSAGLLIRESLSLTPTAQAIGKSGTSGASPSRSFAVNFLGSATPVALKVWYSVNYATEGAWMPVSGNGFAAAISGGGSALTDAKLVGRPAVLFDANGGAGTMTAQIFAKNAAFTLTSNEFTRSGYSFTGWNTIAAGGGTAYADGTSVTFTQEESVTLYAQWQANQAPPAGGSGGGATLCAIQFDTQGGSAVSGKTAPVGGKLSLPAGPTREGYHFTGWYTDPACQERFDPNAPVESALTLYAGWEKVTDSNDLFTDDNGHWAEPYINALGAQGYLSGMGPGVFAPDESLTRAQCAQILYLAFGGKDRSAPAAPFVDTDPDGWYAPALNWAYDKGLITGYSQERFGPQDPITREQMAALILRGAMAFDITLPAGEGTNSFTDDVAIAPYAYDAVYGMQAAGLIDGKPGNLFDPQGLETRGETAKILYGLLTLAGKIDAQYLVD